MKSAQPLHFTGEDFGVAGDTTPIKPVSPPSRSTIWASWSILIKSGMASTKSVVPATQAALLVLHSMFWLTCTVLVATLRAFSMYPNPEERLKLTTLPHFLSFPLSAAMAAIVMLSSQISPSTQQL